METAAVVHRLQRDSSDGISSTRHNHGVQHRIRVPQFPLSAFIIISLRFCNLASACLSEGDGLSLLGLVGFN